ncbi:hypothetical protein SAMN04488598_11927 [Halanaerobium congolense]|jgi:pheromone shutdown protein TraB|uniref:Methyl-accepting chemotaxis protein n=1 Tax=Halanaerobium congolense TaxID=54121 RepID=A0A1G8MR06_9FIRM|nr:hypothetical protein [Halanaerobium congolense]PTX17643.1 hypothetical protein C7953_2441 [Halanaerobium congolense]TDS32371.1 hypothetical protein BY453_10745 [Halanaerobium congolense]SDF67288.1 hypothetical protein SAMN04488598_11927 [Halanaerobium congolense]SDI69730.1 hypothetical protein SAMN04515654_11211 [Halanaerobium congolense]SET02778.1 hypothetical protein SAMN04515652_11817 [Halanaerobium congolense]
MKLFKNLSIKNKIMLGIGLTFILSMFFLLGIVIYQFNDLSAENIYLFTLITGNLTLVNSNYGYQKGNEILRC